MTLEADDEILQDFLVEAGEILEQLNEQLVELDEDQDLTLLLKDYFTVSQLDQIFLQPLIVFSLNYLYI